MPLQNHFCKKSGPNGQHPPHKFFTYNVTYVSEIYSVQTLPETCPHNITGIHSGTPPYDHLVNATTS